MNRESGDDGRILAAVTRLLSRCHEQDSVLPPTTVYNEAWLLRLALDWFDRHRNEDHSLAFSEGARWYAEAMLPSRFMPRFRGDPRAESHTRADAVIGHFDVAPGHHGEARLAAECRQLVAVEAKLASRLSRGVRNSTDFGQASRYAACLAHLVGSWSGGLAPRGPTAGDNASAAVAGGTDGEAPAGVAAGADGEGSRAAVSGAEREGSGGAERAAGESGAMAPSLPALAFYVVAPDRQIEAGVFEDFVTHERIRSQVAARVAHFEGELHEWFYNVFLPVLSHMSVGLLSWESIIEHISVRDEQSVLPAFYERCLRFNPPRRGGR